MSDKSRPYYTQQCFQPGGQWLISNDHTDFGGLAALYLCTFWNGGQGELISEDVPNGFLTQGGRGPGGNTSVDHSSLTGVITTFDHATPKPKNSGTVVVQSYEVKTTLTMCGFNPNGNVSATVYSDGRQVSRGYFDNYVRHIFPFYGENPTPGLPLGWASAASGSYGSTREGDKVWVRGSGIQSYRMGSDATIRFVAIEASALSILDSEGYVYTSAGDICLWNVVLDYKLQQMNAHCISRIVPSAGQYGVRYVPAPLSPPRSKSVYPSWELVGRYGARTNEVASFMPPLQLALDSIASFEREPMLRGDVAQAALDTYRVVNSNNIENAAQLREVSKLLPLDAALHLFDAMSRGEKGAPYYAKAMASLYLWWRYVAKTSYKDFQQWRDAIESTPSLFSKMDTPRLLRAREEFQLERDGLTFLIRDVEHISVSPWPEGGALSKALFTGFEPGIGQAWDLVPFSFVVDWFIPVAGTLRAFDWFAYQSLLGIQYRLSSRKAEAVISLPGCTGELKYRHYKRWFTPGLFELHELLPIPRSVPISSWGLAATALVIAR